MLVYTTDNDPCLYLRPTSCPEHVNLKTYFELNVVFNFGKIEIVKN
jgi:hypothetical protein